MKKAIGIFDSGAGGLAVVKCLNKILPNEDIIFLGDTFRMPYGNKRKNTLRKYALEDTSFFNHFDLKVLGIACNTLDSNCHNIIIKYSNHEVLGLIENTCQKTLKTTKSKRILLLATKATVDTHSYKKHLESLDKDIVIHEIACPELASLIEKDSAKEEIKKELKKYLKGFKDNKVDTIILGCTHYHFISDIVKELIPNTKIISSAYELALSIRKKIRINNNYKGHNYYYLTKIDDKRLKMIKRLFKDSKNIKEIRLKDYK